MPQTTFTLIKPNAMKKNLAGAIIKKFQSKGLQVVGMKMLHLSSDLCEKFYEEHKERPFFQELVDFISSAPVIVMALSGEEAVSLVREIMGDTDPKKAKEDSIRYEYGDSIGENAIHGSDSLKSAERELQLFFTPKELFNK